MGDFDRKEAPGNGAKQNKQVAIAIVLGVVLAGVVGYHLTKQGPQSAVAGSITVDNMPVPMLAPDETPEHAQDALSRDPTHGLLLSSRVNDPSFDQLPRNPFVMDDGWLKTLGWGKPEAVAPVAVGPKQPLPVHIEPQGVRVDAYKLGSIMVGRSGKPSAIINGQIVSAGMIVNATGVSERARVLEVTNDHVVLQNAEFPTGPATELAMQPRMK